MNNLESISDLRSYLRDKENHDLYVVNTSHLDGRRKRSECIMTIASGGRNIHIVVKDTFVPQNIGLKVDTLLDFAKSEDFQNYITLGFLKPIDPVSAQNYLKSQDARDELLRLSDMASDEDLSTGSVQIAPSKNKVNASPKVVGVIMNDMDAARKISALKNIASELTADDVKFIIQNAKDEKIKNWALSFQKN